MEPDDAEDVVPLEANRTVGTQSDFRESEAQTVPWSPEYTLPEPSAKQSHLNSKHNLNGPEVSIAWEAASKLSLLLLELRSTGTSKARSPAEYFTSTELKYWIPFASYCP
jgi:Cilia- and flagella-associated protein 91